MIAGLDAAWFSRVVTDPRGALLAALAEGPAVVLLDNFETPWRPDRGKAEEFVAALLGIQNLWLAIAVQRKEWPENIAFASFEPATRWRSFARTVSNLRRDFRSGGYRSGFC